jgi:hypothetical protein
MIILTAFKYVALETLCSSYVLPGAAYALVSADSDLPRPRSSPRQLCAYWPEFSSPASPRLRCCLTFPSLCLALQRRLLVARRNRSPVVLPRGCGGRAGSELAVDGAGGGGGGGLGVTRQRVILVPFSSCVSQVEGDISAWEHGCLPASPGLAAVRLALMVCAVDLCGNAERMAVWRRCCGGLFAGLFVVSLVRWFSRKLCWWRCLPWLWKRGLRLRQMHK